MTEAQYIQGYQTEISFQKRMLKNLKRWLAFAVVVANSGIIVLYFFAGRHSASLIAGILLLVLGVLSAVVIAYGIYKGEHNLKVVIANFNQGLEEIRRKN